MRLCRPLVILSVLGVLWIAPAADAQVQPYRANDAGGFSDVLPPGANGLTDIAQLAAFETLGSRPRHNDDQLDMYARMATAAPGITAGSLSGLYKDSSFGVPGGDVERTYSPRQGVTIERDAGYGVPHVYGDTRADAMFGLGYAAAEDRLFLMDALRHAGRAELSSFAGGAAGNREMDAQQWRLAPYTEADLDRQGDQLDDLYGAEGRQIQQDADAYVAGINQYIEEARLDPAKMPGEYAAIGRPLGPDLWKRSDIIATASLVGGIFGKGGGQELTQMQLRQQFVARYGLRRGVKLWREWAAYEDPDAPTTVRGRRFPYQTLPRDTRRDTAGIADPGSLRMENAVASGTGSGAPGAPKGGIAGLLEGLLPPAGGDRAMSNALVVSGARSVSGHPLAVFGPQVSYFSPEILMEEDVHAPGLDARGAAFAGVNMYVELGHGRDYAWSATSAGQDIIDTFAVPLCDPDGSAPSLASDHYLFRGSCRPIEVLKRTNHWIPGVADATPPGSQTLVAERTALGIVTARATIKGKPIIYTSLRSTYGHEVDSARGFAAFNDPDQIRNARDFQRAAAKIGYTFNWLYVDDHDMAYFNSGDNPRRARGVTGQLPTLARYEWRGFDPSDNTASYTPFSQHPQLINGQPYITSWNNKEAPGFAGADSNLFSSVFRSQMLDHQIDLRLSGGRKMSLPDLVQAMGEAATTDLRAQKVLPLALDIMGTPSDPKLATAVQELRDWVADGAHRRDLDSNGRYEHAEAIRIMDGFWPRWMQAEFEPTLGRPLFDALEKAHQLDNAPNNHGSHLGSAYQEGWYGYAYKDLRTVLGMHVKQRYTKRYCGGGKLAACRQALLGALAGAVDADPGTLYADPACAKAGKPGDQECYDSIVFRAIGGATQPMIPWQNRPTYQQAVEVQGHRPR